MDSRELVKEYKRIELKVKKLKDRIENHHDLYGYGGSGARQHTYLMRQYEQRVDVLEYVMYLIKAEVGRLDRLTLEREEAEKQKLSQKF